MKIDKPYRGETVTITVTEDEKKAIAACAEKEKRTISGFIRYRLRDVFEEMKVDDRERV